MTEREAADMLLRAQGSSTEWQRDHRGEIIEAFRVVWRTRPSEERFASLTRGLVLAPEILYIMVRE